MLLLAMWMAALAADPLSFQAVRTVEHGKDVPRVVFEANEPGNLDAALACGGRTWRVRRSLARGGSAELRLDGIGPGTHACEGTVVYVQSNGAEGELTFPLEVASLPIVDLRSTLDDIDLEVGTAVVHASRGVAEARVTVYGAKGAQLDQTTGDCSDPTRLRFRWDSRGQEVVKLVVEAVDAHGFRSELELLPWSYSIPHEDVIFETGRDAVLAAEVPKLEAAWAEVTRVVDLYGGVVPMQLYVAGYTDTVGDAASNQALSERRARAIAAWFRQRGFTGLVFFQGFGERGQAVSTGDEVEESRNRRADYTLAAQAPPASVRLPGTAWRAL